MKKKLPPLLLAIAAAFTLALPAKAQTLTFDGTDIDTSVSSDITGPWLEAGTVSWDAAAKTLTLDNATIVSKTNGDNVICIKGGCLTIKLVGSNSVTTDGYKAVEIFNNGQATITGSGSLKTESSWMDIFLYGGTLTIDGCSVETKKEIGSNSTALENHLVVKNATLKTKCVKFFDTISLIGCHIQSPEGATIKDMAPYSDGNIVKYICDAYDRELYDIVIVPGEATSIKSAAASAAVENIYTLYGGKVSSPRPGVNIIRMDDGQSVKVVK